MRQQLNVPVTYTTIQLLCCTLWMQVVTTGQLREGHGSVPGGLSQHSRTSERLKKQLGYRWWILPISLINYIFTSGLGQILGNHYIYRHMHLMKMFYLHRKWRKIRTIDVESLPNKSPSQSSLKYFCGSSSRFFQVQPRSRWLFVYFF